MTKKVVPMIHVPDVRATVAWYEGVGFHVIETYGDAADGLSFAILSFGSGEVMFSSGGKPSARHRREVDLYAYVDDVDGFYERIKDRVEIVEPPHNMFYGMREVIVRDLNGFWVTFGQAVSADVLTPWPAVADELLQPYAGTYKADDGLRVLVRVQDGRLLAFPEDSPGVFLQPVTGNTFKPMMTEDASVTFDRAGGDATGLTFALGANVMRFTRADSG